MLEAEIFRALADPTRRSLYERLTRAESSVGELALGSAVSQPAISQHLAALRAAGLVSERRDGRRTLYRSRPEGLKPLNEWIDRYQGFWPERIERLKTVLKEMDDE
jgi:DNA-binding transcriptional ArsR family regulator